MRVKEEREKTVSKLNIQKAKIMVPSPITSWQIEVEKVEVMTFSFLELQKSLWAMTAAMKLKDTCSLEGKL